MLGFESADHPLEAWIERAVELCRDHGGRVPDGVTTSGPPAGGGEGGTGRGGGASDGAGRDGAVGAWRSAFLRAPYTRDALVRASVIVETFETACTWDRFPELHAAVTAALADAFDQLCGGQGWSTCRFTHVYPDGPAPYFTAYALGRPGQEVALWDEIKVAAAEALAAHGGTITHHHAVGRDHRPWYDRQRPDPFAAALTAAKGALDPAGVLNPGVLLPPPR